MPKTIDPTWASWLP